MDCYDCTAYSAESADRIEYMRAKHPALFSEYQIRASGLKSALEGAING
jgi:hypothetical protein